MDAEYINHVHAVGRGLTMFLKREEYNWSLAGRFKTSLFCWENRGLGEGLVASNYTETINCDV